MTAEFAGPGDYTHCPYCETDLRGERIPEAVAEAYSGTHWRREIGHEIRGVYDGVLYWRCPDCHRPYHRWPVGSFQADAALPYMREWQAILDRQTYVEMIPTRTYADGT